MFRKDILVLAIIQFILLLDNTQQSQIKQAIGAIKAIGKTIKSPLLKQIGNTIKKPIIKTFDNTIKNSAGIFCRNKNTIKNLACGLQEKYLTARHNFGSKSVKYLTEERIKSLRYMKSETVRGGKQLFRTKDKKNIQMRSAAYLSGKGFRPMATKSTKQIQGKELRSLINMVSDKIKPQLPLVLVAGGLNKLTHFNLLPSDDIDLKDTTGIEQVDQHKSQDKAERAAKMKEYNLKNKAKIEKQHREYYLKNRERILIQNRVYYNDNRDKVLERNRQYAKNNKDMIVERNKKYYIANKDKLIAKSLKYHYENRESKSQLMKQYYQDNKVKLIKKSQEYKLNNIDKVIEQKKRYYINNKEKIRKIHREYYQNNRDRVLSQQKEYYFNKRNNLIENQKNEASAPSEIEISMEKKTVMLNNFQRENIDTFVKENKDEYGNVTERMIELTQRRLTKIPNHPLQTLANKCREFYTSESIRKSTLQDYFGKKAYNFYEDFSPLTTTYDNFDHLNIKPDHVSRKKSDTYYVNKETLLRTHTSAHQNYIMKNGDKAFCVMGDVYRRDAIDATHYPAFHQMEAVRLYKVEEIKGFMEKQALINGEPQPLVLSNERESLTKFIIDDLKQTHENLLKFLMGNQDLEMKWVDGYFPFTEPSFELEVKINNSWMEMLGSGIVHQDVLTNASIDNEEYIGWASGIGLERFAMLQFEIPDIRYFWSQNPKFIEQFKENEITKFKPYSKYPACYKDITFWIGNEWEENNFFEVVRTCGGDLIEDTKLVDNFFNKKLNKTSHCYRINYRSVERTLTNEEIDIIQFKIRDQLRDEQKLELR